LEVDEADLRARVARIAVDALDLAELLERVLEPLLADVDRAEPSADDHAVRIRGENALVELDRLLALALRFVRDREVGQDQLRLRRELERLQVVPLGHV